jgi:hypothetical protein
VEVIAGRGHRDGCRGQPILQTLKPGLEANGTIGLAATGREQHWSGEHALTPRETHWAPPLGEEIERARSNTQQTQPPPHRSVSANAADYPPLESAPQE